MKGLDSDCRDVDDHRQELVSEENQKKHVLLNPGQQKLQRYHVDGCLFTGEVKKCDFLILTDGRAYFVELKGGDSEKGCEQLRETIQALHRKLPNRDIRARLVLSKVKKPKLIGKHEKKLKAFLLGLNKGVDHFKKGSKVLTDSLETN